MDFSTAVVRAKKAVRTQSNQQWALGDIALDLEPVEGKTKPESLRLLANEICIDVQTLSRYRRVSAAYPKKADRNLDVSWEVHELFSKQEDCAELVKREWPTFEAAQLELASRRLDKAEAAKAAAEALANKRGTRPVSRQQATQEPEAVGDDEPEGKTPRRQPAQRQAIEPELSEPDETEKPAQYKRRVETSLHTRWARPASNPEDHQVHKTVRTVLIALNAIPGDKAALAAITQDEIRDLDSAIQKISSAKVRGRAKSA